MSSSEIDAKHERLQAIERLVANGLDRVMAERLVEAFGTDEHTLAQAAKTLYSQHSRVRSSRT